MNMVAGSRFPGVAVVVTGFVILSGCANPSGVENDLFPAPSEFSASLVSCESTVFAEMVEEARDANEATPTGLLAIECWSSTRSVEVERDAERLILRLEELIEGEALLQPSRCTPSILEPLEATDGSVMLLECGGSVVGEVSDQSVVIGFYSGVVFSQEQLDRLEESIDSKAFSDFSGTHVEWMLVAGEWTE